MENMENLEGIASQNPMLRCLIDRVIELKKIYPGKPLNELLELVDTGSAQNNIEVYCGVATYDDSAGVYIQNVHDSIPFSTSPSQALLMDMEELSLDSSQQQQLPTINMGDIGLVNAVPSGLSKKLKRNKDVRQRIKRTADYAASSDVFNTTHSPDSYIPPSPNCFDQLTHDTLFGDQKQPQDMYYQPIEFRASSPTLYITDPQRQYSLDMADVYEEPNKQMIKSELEKASWLNNDGFIDSDSAHLSHSDNILHPESAAIIAGSSIEMADSNFNNNTVFQEAEQQNLFNNRNEQHLQLYNSPPYSNASSPCPESSIYLSPPSSVNSCRVETPALSPSSPCGSETSSETSSLPSGKDKMSNKRAERMSLVNYTKEQKMLRIRYQNNKASRDYRRRTKESFVEKEMEYAEEETRQSHLERKMNSTQDQLKLLKRFIKASGMQLPMMRS